MSHYDSYCEICNHEITYGHHADWCKHSTAHLDTDERMISRLVSRYDDDLSVSASRSLHRELNLMLIERTQLLRHSAPWSKDQKPWFDDKGNRQKET